MSCGSCPETFLDELTLSFSLNTRRSIQGSYHFHPLLKQLSSMVSSSIFLCSIVVVCICCAFVHSGPLWVCYPLREAGRGGIYLKGFFCSWNVPPSFQLFNRHLFLLFTSAWHNANIYHLGVKYLLAFTPPQDAHGHPSIGYHQRTYMIMYRDCFYVYACMHALLTMHHWE